MHRKNLILLRFSFAYKRSNFQMRVYIKFMKICVLVRKSILFPSQTCNALEMKFSYTNKCILIEISLYLNHCLDSPIHKGNVSATASAMRKKLTVDDLRSFLLATIADKIFPMKINKFIVISYCFLSFQCC